MPRRDTLRLSVSPLGGPPFKAGQESPPRRRLPQAEGVACLIGPEGRVFFRASGAPPRYKSPSKRSLRPAMISCSSISGKPSRG